MCGLCDAYSEPDGTDRVWRVCRALHPAIRADAMRIRQRALDNARRELSAMVSELEHYEDQFSMLQLRAMRKVMISLRAYIKTLEV